VALIGAWLAAELRALQPRARAPGAAAALAVLALVAASAAVGALASPHHALWTDPEAAALGPSLRHWLGTDHLGRDVAWRLATSTTTFAGPTVLASALAACLGAVLGLAAGADLPGASSARLLGVALAAVPAPVWVVLVGSFSAHAPYTVAAAWAVAMAPDTAAAVERRVESLVRSDFVDGLVAAGLSRRRILVVHLLVYGCARLLCREALLVAAGFLVVDTALGYLGASALPEPAPTWGNMLAFEWGEGGHPIAWIAPVFTLVATLAALHRAARIFVEARRG
jgi:peptide/nickel transport system permease protein